MSDHSVQSSSVQEKITVYSGHDSTILPLILALELPVNQWPPFASRMVFELYRPQSNKQDYLFKIILNGKDLTRELKFCGVDLDRTGACGLKYLTNYYLNLFRNSRYKNYADACNAINKSTYNRTVNISIR